MQDGQAGREYWAAGRRVRIRRRLMIRLMSYLLVVSILVAINLVTGGRWWSLGVAAIWGGVLILRLVTAWVISRRWNRQREVEAVPEDLKQRRYPRT